ncbi:MAG: hypothetical protein JNK75_03940 [Betaproteobacteria bacterium]|nr:hypothetical protein [Betaproteobacteria bacterium]
MKRLLATWPLLIACPVLAQKAPEPPKPVVVKPSAKHEKCFNLEAGQKLEYQFDSTVKVNFSLSYKQAPDQTYFPVKLDRTLGEGGLYEARARNRYCLAWENRTDKDAEINLSAKVRK